VRVVKEEPKPKATPKKATTKKVAPKKSTAKKTTAKKKGRPAGSKSKK
jgi:hypothetical protein